MSPEERELLKKSVSLAEDNNKMLHSMRRSQRWSDTARIVYWILIIGSAIGAYYFVQPYLDELTKMYQSVSNGLKNFPK